ncbi:CxxH/CxxC protein [Alteribacillus sp. HJP-4]|uniref:CxxH/CxxC protein n=1 Tax=Alteribacillus sp. HJP-4 TaxID=2775394 RepID=UPI0035CCE0FF
MIYTCAAHAERGLDDAIDKTGEPPIMEKKNNILSTKCCYCTDQSVYKIYGMAEGQV